MWLFQGVVNAGLQILLSIFGGWLCAWLRLVDPEVLSRQLNAFAMRAAFPAFIIHLLGIKTDLQDLEAWKALGVFVLWVLLIQLSCIAWHKLQGGSSTVQTLGLNCLLLTTNNTGCIGWPVLIATVGRQGAALSMLLGVLFFVQLLPAATTCFEYHKFLQEHLTAGPSSSLAAADTPAEHLDQTLLPATVHPAQRKAVQAAAAFPHEFRYCYWSNADYIPSKSAATAPGADSSKFKLLEQTADKASPYPSYVEVCVDATEDADYPEGELQHHCYGNGYLAGHSSSSSSSSRGSSNAAARRNAMTSGQQTSAAVVKAGSSAATSTAAAAAAAKQWWRSSPPGGLQKQQTGLRRAKDSCESLHSPFAAAIAGCGSSSQEAGMQQRPHAMQAPRPGQQLRTLTRRLSRGLGQQTTTPRTSAADGLVRAASLRKKQPQQRGLLPGMSVAQLSCHEGIGSCHGGTTERTLAASSGMFAGSAAAGCARAAGGAGSSAASSGGTSNGTSLDGTSCACKATSAACTEQQQDAAGRSRTIGAGVGTAASFARAADSAVELHSMCHRASDCTTHQQQEGVQGSFSPSVVLETQVQQGLAGDGSRGAASAHIAAAAAGPGSYALFLQNSSIASGGEGPFLQGFGLGGNNATAPVSSSTALLGLGVAPGCAVRSAAQLGAATAAMHAQTAAFEGTTKLSSMVQIAATADHGADASTVKDLQTKTEVTSRRGCFGAFMRKHPLLTHITAVQLKSFHLWLNVLAIALSVSGARKYLDADSPLALPALGWLDGLLGWFSGACVPVLLFANGVWMAGKDITGGRRGQMQVALMLLLKLAVLPALMIGLTQLVGMRNSYGLSLVLLSSCPLAPLAFLVCQQYGVGAELATSVTIQGVLLMLPQMMAIIKISQVAGLYNVQMLKAA